MVITRLMFALAAARSSLLQSGHLYLFGRFTGEGVMAESKFLTRLQRLSSVISLPAN